MEWHLLKTEYSSMAGGKTGMRGEVGSPGLCGWVVLSITFGQTDEVRNRTMNKEVCKQGSEEQPGRGLARVVEGRDGRLKVQGM